MDTIKEILLSAFESFNTGYKSKEGIPRFSVGKYSYDPIYSAEINYKVDIGFNRIKELDLNLWKDFGCLTKELEHLLRQRPSLPEIVCSREPLENKNCIITIFYLETTTYERYLIENEEDFCNDNFKLFKNRKFREINEPSEDPIFFTMTKFYGFLPKN